MEEKKGIFSRIASWGPFRAVAERIRNKLLVSLLALALIPLIILGVVVYIVAQNALMQQAFDNLQSVGTIKSIAIQHYFDERQGDMDVLVETVASLREESFDKLSAVEELKANEIEAWVSDRTGDTLFARNLVVVKGTESITEGLSILSEFKDNPSHPAYVEAFGRAESVLGSFAQEKGQYADIMLVDLDGDVVFALDPESLGDDEGGSVEFQEGLKGLYVGDIVYVAAHDELNMRITAPVIDDRGRTIGVIFMEMDIDKINVIMQGRTGLGETAETYLVGKVGDEIQLRSNRVVKTGQIGDPKSGPDAENALAGLSGQTFKVGSTGAYEISVYSPLQIPNQNWAIIATASVEEIIVPKLEGAEKDYLTRYQEAYGYYDIFLFSPDGYLFYTVIHEQDYQTNLLTGPYKDSNLGQLVAEILETKEAEFADFERYAPSQDAPAAFIAAPLLSTEGEVELVVAVQLSPDQINAVMQEYTGLGESGETYLVGQDKLWRSDSRFLATLGVTSTILNPSTIVDTVASRSGLAGQTGTRVIDDYQGIPVLSSWSSITLVDPDEAHPEGIKWAVMSEINYAEVRQPVVTMALIAAGLVVGAAILVVVIALLLAGGLTTQVGHIMDLFSEIGIGEFGARAKVTSSDELGNMAFSLNAMLDNTLTLIQSREERDSIQGSIMKLLEEVGDVAQGDLTVEAEVTPDMTGAIADAFNFMIDALRGIITDVQDATLNVSSSAQEIRATAEHLAQGSESQALQISGTATAIEEMAVSIQQVSENASLSATVGEQAVANARQGTVVVQETIAGMTRIRTQVQETSKRIKRLGESSQEVGEIVQLIGDIADRTSILALNASIQAAMAGEAGRGFAVVAEEVERLAERSTEATKQIGTLVRTIQGETNEAVTAMESTTHEVVSGSQLANQAGQALAEIESVSTRLGELIQSISLASKQQARGSEALARSMEDISQVTQQTAAGTKQAAVSISNLAGLADSLRDSVSAFKLPGGNGNGQR